MKKLLTTLAILLSCKALAAPPAFRAFSGIVASTGVDLAAITIPASCATNDIMVLLTWVRDVDDTITIDASGDSWEQISTACTSACDPNIERSTISSYWVFWERHDGTVTNPVVNKSGTTGDTYAALICYSGAETSGNPFEVIGTFITDGAEPTDVTGITSLTADSLIVVPVGGEDNLATLITTTGTDPATYVEHYVESATGADGAITFSEQARTTAGATGAITVDWDAATNSGGVALALKPPPPPTCVTGLNLLLLHVGGCP